LKIHCNFSAHAILAIHSSLDKKLNKIQKNKFLITWGMPRGKPPKITIPHKRLFNDRSEDPARSKRESKGRVRKGPTGGCVGSSTSK